ncbi:Arc family DNA-binding protein [Roseobacter sp. AzwK-3b]|uniref:Arc family DNA-binding protein n=1 Tax=Roseobacter sp. AzwK-3b TaxID=351016 RepID=UPI000A03BB91|nr:Arc family DNA-binding protein [Roseobacter sp. AzwK-3b]
MAYSPPKTQQEPPYGLRMPPSLKERVKAAAKANNRSMNAEIVAALEDKFPEDFHLSIISHALTSLKLSLHDEPLDKEALRQWVAEAEEELEAYRSHMVRGDRGSPF